MKDTLPNILFYALYEVRPLEIPTPQLIAQFAAGKKHPRGLVWGALQRLEKRGEVQRKRRGKVTYWRSL